MNWRPRGVLIGCALLVAGCGSSGDDSPTGRDSDSADPLPASATGLFLVDCWNDRLNELTPAGATLGATYRISAVTAEGVSAVRLCGWQPTYGISGLTPYNSDGTILAASTRGGDGSSHVGFVTVSDAAFTDVSARMPFDANGNFVDKGSDADKFAGPIKDSVLGFGPDDTFYLNRAGVRYAAAGPGYESFQPLDESAVVASMSPDGSRSVSTSFSGVVISLPAGTPAVVGDDMNPGFAGITVEEKGGLAPLDCDTVDWIDADHLICGDSSAPTLVALVGGALEVTAELSDERYCGACYDRVYLWTLPAGAQTPLTPDSSRDLFGFRADPASGVVYFLADNGTTMQLYQATVQPGAVPELLGEIAVGDDPAGSSWMDLLVR